MASEEIEAAKANLEAEHAKVMQDLGDVWVAIEAVRSSAPTDNLHDLLAEVEDAVEKARHGGLLGSGANAHRRALRDWQELTGGDS
ncbi:MAG: hypothetical protein ACR2QO_18285 [Acidimicrobiales bacterium]